MNSTRRRFLQLGALSGGAILTRSITAVAAPLPPETLRISRPGPFELDEITITELQNRLASGKLSSVALVKKYVARIRQIDDRLRSVLELNPDALSIAAALDRERKSKGPRGPLHGIPVLIKDNIATHDRMTTTAGSLALAGSVAPRDAFLVQQLRAAGAIILGKTHLCEWANFRGDRSTSGWSGRGGPTRNPYALDRNPSGSSSGSAVAIAANLCSVAVGTETDGSILSPARFNGVVGLKPTVGLVSRSGIIPISRTQDTAGPMARTVTDAAILLGAMTGDDSRDSATAASPGKALRDYTRFLDPEGLRGARIGVARRTFTGHPEVAPLMDRLLAEMTRRGAVLIDPISLPPGSGYASEVEVLQYEFKAGLNEYLADLGPDAPVHTLREVIEFNERHAQQEMPWFKQETLIKSEAKGPLTEQAYLDALAKCRKASRDDGIDALMKKNQLDAIFCSGGGPAPVIDYAYGDGNTGGGGIALAAVAGYPSISVPAGFIEGMPVSVFFMSGAWSEPSLLRIAFAFEQAIKARKPPGFLPTISPSELS
jgi:amidase